jgi:hypothetical protein
MIRHIHWLAALTVVSACTVTATPAPSRPYEPPPRTVVREPRHEPPPPEPMPPPPPREEPPPPPPPRHEPRGEEYTDWKARGWISLGEHTVDGRVDTDMYEYSQKMGKISRIMIVVLDSDLELLECKITSVMGDIHTPQVDRFFREGSRTRPIELPKGEILRKVELRYKNITGGGRARVQVWAK